jgi:5-oxoprolinase (ATP-hydrolysing) subunit A
MQKTIDINCDMGEGIGNDAQLMPLISSANIACGGHAGDAATMQWVVQLCLAHQVAIGAHPGFADKANFGRVVVPMQPDAIEAMVREQILALQKIARQAGASLKHVKPHGALYNLSAKDEAVAGAIAKAVHSIDKNLVLVGLAGSVSCTLAESLGLQVVHEVFADRTYQPDGSLTPRTAANALIETDEAAMEQVLGFVQNNSVKTVNGNTISMKADSICLHGDGAHALAFANIIHEKLLQSGFAITAPSHHV